MGKEQGIKVDLPLFDEITNALKEGGGI